MAVELAGGVRVSEMREGDPLVHGTVSVWPQIGRASGAQVISLRVMEFRPGLSPSIRNDTCDQIGYFLARRSDGLDGADRRTDGADQSNQLPAARFFVDGKPCPIEGDMGVYLKPNAVFAVDNPGPDSIVLITSLCPDPDQPPSFVDIASPVASTSSPEAAPIVRLSDRPSQTTADRWYRVLVDDAVGSHQVTQFVGSIPPGRAPDHFHQYEEVLFILRGEGRMWAGETRTPIAAGSCIYLPRGQVHCVENTGQGELRVLGVFYPAGSPSVRYET